MYVFYNIHVNIKIYKLTVLREIRIQSHFHLKKDAGFYFPSPCTSMCPPAGHSRALCVQTLLTQATWSMTSELQESKTGEKTVTYMNSWYSQEGSERNTKQTTSLRKIISFSRFCCYVIIGKWPNQIPACDADGLQEAHLLKENKSTGQNQIEYANICYCGYCI